jgi:membrane associated rhomboid family serine protease
VTFDAIQALWTRDKPSFSAVGTGLLVVSIAVMLWLARAKRHVAQELRSEALAADASQTTACWWLSVAALMGVGLNGLLGWWWADPVAALAISTLIVVPMVGASGAISGVMGAYLILFPRVRVFTLVTLGFFITTVALPAWTMLLYWMALQMLGGLSSIGAEGGGVAFWAHVGGFVAGVVLVKLFARPDHLAEHRHHHWQPQRSQWG